MLFLSDLAIVKELVEYPDQVVFHFECTLICFS